MRNVIRCGAALLLAASTAFAAEPQTLSLDDALRLALERNVGLRRAGTDVDAAEARMQGASLVIKDNPSIVGMLGPRSSVVGQSLDYGFELLQPIEVAGQRGARIDSAEATRTAAEQRVLASRIIVTARVREQFARALAAEQRLILANDAWTLAKESREAAEERFRAGAAPLLEVNTARVELGRATRERAQVEQARVVALTTLRVLIGVDPQHDVVLVGDLRKLSATPELQLEPLVERALAQRAEVKEAHALKESALADEQLALREAIPTPRVGLSVAHEQETKATIVKGMLGLDLPFFNRNPGARATATVRVRQADLAMEAAQQLIRQHVVVALARVRAAQAAADGYADEVVKAMEQNMELVNDSYRAGKIDFLQLVVIRNQAISARREHIDVLEELSAARAELDLAVGNAPTSERSTP